MDSQPTLPSHAEIQPTPADVATPRPPGQTAAVWTDLLGLWTGRPAERAELLLATTIRTSQALLAASRTTADAMHGVAQRQQEAAFSVARHQQDLLFATARAALSALGKATIWANGAPQRALTAYGEACGRSIEAANAFGSAALRMQCGTPPNAGTAAQR
ncbi:hypothetical protein GCM10011504_54080 [Siccirubricoccus deserti]|uniref:Phasin domain-containing protein n=1 Tax=Siccirubricoccus deserti TaxID=2013562 RepID=A0A9X0UFQ7_9PROT|nr:hypothetical protein [Siccirubricoccus deserti]MBC4019032.1 hypothetical protein [Siccirubricoccus deserti]GGC69384.1 hypothetical protein GCM10011504_54080 [Siccirubricoccus deserti]